jgi:MFS family permease
MLSDLAPGERSGTAVGIFRFAGDVGFVLAPIVVGLAAAAFGFRPAFWVAAVPVAVGLILALGMPETLPMAGGGQSDVSTAEEPLDHE